MFIFTLQDIIGMAFVGLFVLWWLLNLIGGRITAARRKNPTNPKPAKGASNETA